MPDQITICLRSSDEAAAVNNESGPLLAAYASLPAGDGGELLLALIEVGFIYLDSPSTNNDEYVNKFVNRWISYAEKHGFGFDYDPKVIRQRPDLSWEVIGPISE